jgi:decaprenylphospho-beta-D-ribofuranose 2-oxidase
MTTTGEPERHVLSGWGESHHVWACVRRPRDAEEVSALVRMAAAHGRRLCLRGAGRSYGDAAVLSGGDVLDLTRMNRIRAIDADAGIVVAEGGVTIEDLWRAGLPVGLWPAVVPGTMRPTLAGCVAMNVHGKNHFRVGGFGEHVLELELVTGTGELFRVTPQSDPEVFRAVVGGIGLLGVVTSVTLHLKRVHSGLLDVTAVPLRSFEALFEEFERRAPQADYLVGWVDCFDGSGRSVLHDARHLPEGADRSPAATLSTSAQELPPRIAGAVPRDAVPALLSLFASHSGMRFVNAAKYRLTAMRGTHRFRQSHVQFAFLLDYVPGWKRIYAPGGLIQYQSFVPRAEALRVHRELLELCRRRGIVSWLGVYKKHRDCPFLLTHAMDGYSLALDFPVTEANRERLWALCHEMDELVLAAGGRFYFAKDLTARPDTLRRAYPHLDRFLAIKRRLDPHGVFTSDLARRLGLTTES